MEVGCGPFFRVDSVLHPHSVASGEIHLYLLTVTGLSVSAKGDTLPSDSRKLYQK